MWIQDNELKKISKEAFESGTLNNIIAFVLLWNYVTNRLNGEDVSYILVLFRMKIGTNWERYSI